jgi:hypothetical protein
MKVKDLIASLAKVDQEADVYVWIDGDRLPVQEDGVDDSFLENIVDINVEIPE